MIKRLSLAIFLVVVIMLAGCTPKSVEKESLRIGSLPRNFDIIAYVAQQEGIFDKQGIVVQIVPFRSEIEMDSALLAGELDGIIDDLFMAVLLSKEKETVRIVGWNAMPGLLQIVTSPGSDIASPVDLKGKEIAVSINSIMDYGLDRLLVTEGLTSEDIVKVNVPSMPLRVQVLSQGEVSAAILTPPLSDMAIFNGGRVILEDTKSFVGPGLIFSVEALRGKSDSISRFIQAWQQAVELINDEPEKYHGLLTEVAKIPEAVREDVEMPTFPTLRLPTEAEVDPIVSWMINNELISEPINYEQVVDTTYLK
ncbi:ABC transporter substrate-binding protein [Chloroflexota bacterium]